MIRFIKITTCDSHMMWDVRRIEVNPDREWNSYIGHIDLFEGVASLKFCGEASAVELAHVSAFMLELEAQHRMNSFSEQIEKDLQPVARQEVSHGNDCHSNGSANHDELRRTRILDSVPAVVTGDRADRINVGT